MSARHSGQFGAPPAARDRPRAFAAPVARSQPKLRYAAPIIGVGAAKHTFELFVDYFLSYLHDEPTAAGPVAVKARPGRLTTFEGDERFQVCSLRSKCAAA